MTVLEQINPAELSIDANVRSDVGLDKDFLASVREHGVLQPVVGHRVEDGGVHVLYGQRRTLAAIETKLEQIPVYVVDSLKDADRLARQVVENDHRRALTDHDRSEAFHQLSLLGVSAAQIAKKTGAKKTAVDSALKVRQNETATAALAQGWTLEQSAALDEFADDDEAIADIEAVVADEPAMFDHVVQRLRDRREADRLIAEATTEQEKAGKTVVEAAGYLQPENQYVHALNRPDGEPATDDDADAVTVSLAYDRSIIVRPVITGWEAKGFTTKYDIGAPGGKTGPMTDEEKTERRRVIANNKEWDSAEIVRRDFLKSLLKGKTPLKNALRFIAQSLGVHGNTAADGVTKYGTYAAELLGGKGEFGELATITVKPNGRHETNLLAMVLAGFEHNMSRQSWRTPTAAERHYLTQLEAWGYTLSDVERIITDHGKTETEEQ